MTMTNTNAADRSADMGDLVCGNIGAACDCGCYEESLLLNMYFRPPLPQQTPETTTEGANVPLVEIIQRCDTASTLDTDDSENDESSWTHCSAQE